LIGFGTEHGPFLISGGGHLRDNPYSWNKFASVLYVEIPAVGVGFSYSDHPAFDRASVGDAQTAVDSLQLVLEFLKRFPERRSNEFYVASESYGGHYVPQLALEILKHNDDERTGGHANDSGGGAPGTAKINFKGWMVGNPYVDPYTNAVTQVDAFYGHGLLSKPTYDRWRSACTAAHGDNEDSYKKFRRPECTTETQKVFASIWQHKINPYALDYPVCAASASGRDDFDDAPTFLYGGPDEEVAGGNSTVKVTSLSDAATANQRDDSAGGSSATVSSQVNALLNRTGILHERNRKSPPFLPKREKYRPCSEVYLERYLNRPDVQKVLHVAAPSNSESGRHRKQSVREWAPCSRTVDYDMHDFSRPVVDLYRKFVRGDSGLKMLVFSGDDDAVCSTAGTQSWIWDLGVDALPGREWQPWKVDERKTKVGRGGGHRRHNKNGRHRRHSYRDQTAGFLTVFDVSGAANASSPSSSSSFFAFATVHGAGHEVAAYRPVEALDLFRRFLNDDLL